MCAVMMWEHGEPVFNYDGTILTRILKLGWTPGISYFSTYSIDQSPVEPFGDQFRLELLSGSLFMTYAMP